MLELVGKYTILLMSQVVLIGWGTQIEMLREVV